ncbi:Gfo/Idh/MocA family oxidoreductase [Seongchinamella unica]|uniref:Gfo/Idh/MocA family oxidoreductase n=1 Tax=Seongchinamella unica TaxID=2547392 RepID=A0A4R5LT40_9GAMM|nr:Gfo/Idh/MocA family oxidoreductase [Seongchinamella unica]TDG14105.1 Gfo/Idh/MocA family oxidoreductase [Seongchinamella unica]
MVDIKDGANYAPTSRAEAVVSPGEFCFASAYLDHGHIYGQTNGLRDAGATLKYVYDPDPEKVRKFCEAYPGVVVAESFEQILADPAVRLVNAAAIPDQRATIGIRVMESGRDYLTDKSPFTSLEQLEAVRKVVAQTGRKYAVYYAERLHNDAAWRAGELIAQGALGRVLQVLNLAPHRLAPETRPDWFFNKRHYGGILTDIGSHQVEQFLTYAGCNSAHINFARVENFSHPDKPGLEDFGELSLTGDNGASFYTRVDWYTPEGLRTWGDGRCFIVGTEGTMELRKYLDVGGAAPSSKLILVDGSGESVEECQDTTGFPYFGQLILDCIHRTENAMTQAHAFLAAELSMRAQALADRARGQ